MRSDADEHVLVVEATEAFTKGVIAEEVSFVAVFALIELIPVVIHIRLIKSIKLLLSFRRLNRL